MNIKKKLMLFSTILLAFFMMSGCSRPDSDSIGINSDASTGSFEWGAEKDDISARAESLGLTVSESERFIALKDVPIFDTTATVNFSFTSFSKSDFPMLSDDTPLLLTGANILLSATTKEAIVKTVSEILGSQETYQLVFYSEADYFGYKKGNELEPTAYYWHSDKNLLERTGVDRLGEIYPELTLKEITQRFYASYAYTVYIKDANDVTGLEDGAVLLEILADSGVVEQIIGS